MFSDTTLFVPFVLASPVFSNTTYNSSERSTQFTDAVQRAEFFHMADDDWHTILKPRVATPRAMVLLKGPYQFALNADGSCCLFVLIDENRCGNALFPGLCQNNLEVGDVIEVLTNAVFPINLNGVAWHPQTEALLPWFVGVTPSKAFHGAYSYPDITALTQANVS